MKWDAFSHEQAANAVQRLFKRSRDAIFARYGGVGEEGMMGDTNDFTGATNATGGIGAGGGGGRGFMNSRGGAAAAGGAAGLGSLLFLVLGRVAEKKGGKNSGKSRANNGSGGGGGGTSSLSSTGAMGGGTMNSTNNASSADDPNNTSNNNGEDDDGSDVAMPYSRSWRKRGGLMNAPFCTVVSRGLDGRLETDVLTVDGFERLARMRPTDVSNIVFLQSFLWQDPELHRSNMLLKATYRFYDGRSWPHSEDADDDNNKDDDDSDAEKEERPPVPPLGVSVSIERYFEQTIVDMYSNSTRVRCSEHFSATSVTAMKIKKELLAAVSFLELHHVRRGGRGRSRV